MADKNEKAKFEWGFTKMYHAVKKHFGLSDAEYIYMDMIANLAPQHGGWTHISNATSAEALGYSARAIDGYNKKLKAAGLLETKEFENGDRVGKRGTAFWWECINNVKVEIPTAKNAPPTAKNAHPCANSAHPYAKDAPPPAKDAHYTISNNISNTLDNDFSKEKSTAVFSEKNFESENQPLPRATEPEKKEKEKKVAQKKEKDETVGQVQKVQHFNANQIKAVNKPMFVSNTLWDAFIDAVICGLPNQTPKNKIAVGRFNTWTERLEKEAATYSEPALLEIIQAYKISQDPNLREGKNAWLSIFHSDFANHIQRIEKNLKSTTQNQNSQNGKHQPNNQNISQQQTAEYLAKQQRPDF